MKFGRSEKLLTLSFLLFCASLATPAFHHLSYNFQPPKIVPFEGWESLAFGWIAALLGFVGIFLGDFSHVGLLSWLANPLLLIGWIAVLTRSTKLAKVVSSAAFVLTLLFLSVKTVIGLDNTGFYNITVSVGYFLWVASTVFAYAAAIFRDPN